MRPTTPPAIAPRFAHFLPLGSAVSSSLTLPSAVWTMTAATPVAYLVERRPSAPPALVSFLPAFWLLVPGALGLIGVTEYISRDVTAGVRTSSQPSRRSSRSPSASSAATPSTARSLVRLAAGAKTLLSSGAVVEQGTTPTTHLPHKAVPGASRS
jgi:hypothetical protein